MYAEITPHHLAALSVRRAADALEQTEADPTTWFFVILDLHRALYCALIAALSGSAGIGAYPDKLRIEWIDWFERSRMDPKTNAPTGDYVLSFGELLEKAENSPLELQNSRLQLTSEQRTDISKLNEFRGDLEHVKPRSCSLQLAAFLGWARTLPRRSPRYFRHFHTNWNQKRLSR
jgi:hypothetical protein